MFNAEDMRRRKATRFVQLLEYLEQETSEGERQHNLHGNSSMLNKMHPEEVENILHTAVKRPEQDAS